MSKIRLSAKFAVVCLNCYKRRVFKYGTNIHGVKTGFEFTCYDCGRKELFIMDGSLKPSLAQQASLRDKKVVES